MGVKNFKNKSYIIAEGVFSNILTLGIQSFSLTALAIYFECSPFWLSLMASLPVATQLLQIFIGKFYKVFRTRKKALLMSSILGRIPFLFLPLAVLFKMNKPFVLISAIVIYSIFNSFTLGIWTASMRDAIEKQERGSFFAKRFVFISVSTIVFSYLAGKMLNLPNEQYGILAITLGVAFSSIVSIFFFFMQEIPDTGEETERIKISFPLKNRNFRNFLIFIAFWNFSIEFSKPYFSYFSVTILKVPYTYLGYVAAITGLASIVTYPALGKLADKYGNKKIVSRGIVMSTYVVMLFVVMGKDNYRSLLLMDALGTSVAWGALNLCMFNLLLEVAEDPIDSYVASYFVTMGIFGLLGGLVGGVVGSLIKDSYFTIMGDTYHGIQGMIMLGIFLRLYSVLLLTRVNSYEKSVYYEGILPSNLNILRRR